MDIKTWMTSASVTLLLAGCGASTTGGEAGSPIISILGQPEVTVEAGTSYNDQGALAVDKEDGDINVNTTNNVKINVVGIYTVNYLATDSEGNETTINRIVNVIDTTPPVITFDGTSSITLEVGASLNYPAVTAVDSVDGNLDVTQDGSINESLVGVQVINYTATDLSGNQTQTALTVEVIDTTPPVIVMNGESSVAVEILHNYAELGAVVTDNSGIDLSITTSGFVDIMNPGTYYVTYTATDSSGNGAFVQREVIVADTTAPSIEIFGANPMDIEYGGTYVESGAQGFDEPVMLIDVIETGEIDTSILGEQLITYTATDSSGNTTSINRVVNVIDSVQPELSIIGESSITIYTGNYYEDQGATAIDNYDGEMTSSIETTSNVDTVSAGVYTVSYTATDSSGNVAQATRTINVRELTYAFGFRDNDPVLYENSYTHSFIIDMSNVEYVDRTYTVTVESESTATLDTDFKLITTQMTVPAGESSTKLTLEIIDDEILEYSESIVLTISAADYSHPITFSLTDVSNLGQTYTDTQTSGSTPTVSVIDDDVFLMSTNQIERYGLIDHQTKAVRTTSGYIPSSFSDGVVYNNEPYNYINGKLYKLDKNTLDIALISQSTWYSEWTSEIVVLGDTLYIPAGKTQFENNSTQMLSYNFVSGTWDLLEPMSNTRYGGATAVVDDKIYVFGGNYSNDTSETYDTTTNTWSAITTNTKLGGYFDTAVSYGERIIVTSSQLNGAGEALIYDTVNDTWTEKTLTIPTRNYQDSFTYKGMIYLIGGSDNSGQSKAVNSYYLGDD